MDTTYSGTTTGGTLPTPQARAPKLYRPGMTQQQFQQALAADPGYQAILHDPANQGPHGLTPAAWVKAQAYAGDAGLNDLNAQTRDDVAGAFHGGGSRYTVDGNGSVQESHDSWANPETGGALLGIGIGGAVAAPYIAGALSGSAASGGAATGAGGSASVLGPSTASSMAATSAVASGAPAGIAAGGTGAATGGSILGTLGKVAANKGGDMATRAAAGMGAERTADNYADMNAAGQNNRALLDSAVFNRDLPSVQSSQVARGDLMATMHDAAPTGDPRIDKFGGGGLRPSAFGPSTQQAGDALKRQALQNLMTGGGKITPQLTTPKRAGLGENALAGAGIGLNILDAYNRWGS